MNHELAKTLTTALVQFIDRERPEGTMDCSSGECVSLEKAFTEENFDSVETLINKKLSRLTEFEKAVGLVFTDAQLIPRDKDGIANIHDINEFIKKKAAELLALAKKELCNGCNANLEGYIKGQQDAKRQYNESVAYHFPIMPQRPLCYEPGGTCPNPQMDCINCPRWATGGGFNTSSGTSAAKAEG